MQEGGLHVSLYALVYGAQNGNQDDKLALVEKFDPLLKKYAKNLGTEDAYCELREEFLRILANMNLLKLENRKNGAVFNYLKQSIHNSFNSCLGQHIKHRCIVRFADLSEVENYYLEKRLIFNDNRFLVEYGDVLAELTDKEKYVVISRFIDGDSMA
jgi:hypothetical protein